MKLLRTYARLALWPTLAATGVLAFGLWLRGTPLASGWPSRAIISVGAFYMGTIGLMLLAICSRRPR